VHSRSVLDRSLTLEHGAATLQLRYARIQRRDARAAAAIHAGHAGCTSWASK
jgi:hypothetical protein